MNVRVLRCLLATTVGFLAVVGIAQAQSGAFDLSWNTIDGGGGTSAGGGFEVSGTIGQPDAGTMTGGEFRLTGGFRVARPCGSVVGDFDCDGDADLHDFVVFLQCFAGPRQPPAGTCPAGVDADLSNDGHVDVRDFYVFVQHFTGPLAATP